MKPTRDEQAFADLLEGMRAEAPREVARMAALAAALEHARPMTGPAPAFRDALRNRLLAETAVRRPWFEGVRTSWIERNARMRRSFRFVFANAVAAVVLLAGGSIMAVAQESVPGDWDYFAKRLHEDARLLITRAPEPRAYLQMELARERLDEVRELVNRSETNPDHYSTALDDMDARTLDASLLLIELYGETADRVPLDRLTKFAVAQRQGLEVLVERLPAAARPQARDSIDILERVSERVTGIMGGCLCPANPLVPSAGPPATGGDQGGAGTAGPQAPLCPCAEFRGDDDPTTDPIAGPTDPGPTPPPNPTTPPVDPDVPIDLPPLPVVGDDVDDVVNDLIDDVLEPILEPILGPSPIPTITIPPLPLGLGN
ncbi:MAG TPA: DUF5667 domain-containing protein [Actinomycetota bacterium]|nr:DUF5667 domain-containing protein [Actinomycetota bacterium]